MAPLVIGQDAGQDAVIVHARGDVDTGTVEKLRLHLTAALDAAATHPARVVIVDLLAVNFFGSAGLNAVLDCHEAGVAAGTSVRLVADHSRVLQPIEVTELDRILHVYPTVSEALHEKPAEDLGRQ